MSSFFDSTLCLFSSSILLHVVVCSYYCIVLHYTDKPQFIHSVNRHLDFSALAIMNKAAMNIQKTLYR